MKNNNKKIKVGIIGCGKVAVNHHFPSVRSINKIELYAISDNNEERLNQSSELTGISRCLTDYKELLNIKFQLRQYLLYLIIPYNLLNTC